MPSVLFMTGETRILPPPLALCYDDTMKRPSVRPILLALAAASALTGAAPSENRSALPFIADDYSRALVEARAKKLPIFVEAWAPW